MCFFDLASSVVIDISLKLKLLYWSFARPCASGVVLNETLLVLETNELLEWLSSTATKLGPVAHIEMPSKSMSQLSSTSMIAWVATSPGLRGVLPSYFVSLANYWCFTENDGRIMSPCNFLCFIFNKGYSSRVCIGARHILGVAFIKTSY